MLLITGSSSSSCSPCCGGRSCSSPGLVLRLVEVFGIWRLVRRKKVQAGAETLIGRTATVIAACNPLGQVRLSGESEIWRARCAEGAERGETVRVVGINELTLIVER